MISPDGTAIAYTSNKSGTPEIYVSSFPEMTSTVQVSIDGGSDPLWSPDGGELYFWRWTESLGENNYESFDMMALKVVPGQEPSFSKPEKLFNRSWVYHHAGHANYDVTDDGRFIMIDYKGEALSVTRLRVMLNWLDAVKEK